MTKYVAVDLETSGLDPEWHEIIEVGLVTDDRKLTFSLPYYVEGADPEALRINGALTRKLPPEFTVVEAGNALTEWLGDAFIVGKNPTFDVDFLKAFFRHYGLDSNWHHRLIDVGPLAWGYHHGSYRRRLAQLAGGSGTDRHSDLILEPPNTQEVAKFMNIPLPEDQQHTALADAEWAFRVFRKIVPNVT